jgi:hypothetical protein
MFRSVAVIFLFFLLSACSGSSLDKLIPDSSYEKLSLNIPLEIETQTGKSVKGGTLLECYGIVPFDFDRNHVEMALLKAIKTVKEKTPDCEWVVVWLSPDERIKKWGFCSGHAEYKEGVISLDLASPTSEQLDEWNRRNANNLGYRLANFNKDTFKEAIGLITKYEELDKKLKANERVVKREGYPLTVENYHSEEDILKLLASKDSMNLDRAKTLYHSLYKVYGHMEWGGKIIKLNSAGKREELVQGT